MELLFNIGQERKSPLLSEFYGLSGVAGEGIFSECPWCCGLW